MNICGQEFKFIDTYETSITVPDCNVLNPNKIGSGNGEAKLYFGSKDKMREFYGGEGFNARCFMLRSDLLAYLETMKTEYFNPTQNYRKRDEMKELWAERLEYVKGLPDVIEFNVQDQTQIAGPRGYVNSSDEGYNLFRLLALPLVSYISAMELQDKGKTPIYYWKLFADFDAIQDKAEAQVFTYGKIKEEGEKKATKKEKEQSENVRQARKGQGIYREKMLQECQFCPFTMINDERLLIASHTKPHAVCDDKECIDPKNGFILSPLYDKLFDRGFMTFTSDRRVVLSNWLSPQNQRKLGVKNDQFIQMLPLDAQREVYMKYHREFVFKG